MARSRSSLSGSSSSGLMARLFSMLLVVLVLGAVGGAVLLATWDIPAPETSTETVIPDERFPR